MGCRLNLGRLFKTLERLCAGLDDDLNVRLLPDGDQLIVDRHMILQPLDDPTLKKQTRMPASSGLEIYISYSSAQVQDATRPSARVVLHAPESARDIALALKPGELERSWQIPISSAPLLFVRVRIGAQARRADVQVLLDAVRDELLS